MYTKIKGDCLKFYFKYVMSIVGISIILLSFHNTASGYGTVNTIENLTRKQCLEKPISACAPNEPCVTDTDKIFLTSNVPDCAQDNPAKTFKNADRINRHFCFFNGSALDAKPRPLVIYLHGGSGNAYNVYGSSLLRTKAETFPLGPSANGFHLLSLQARNLNGYEIDLSPSTHHDAFWWDFRAPSTNPDIRDLDDIIASIVAKYPVDKSRIYLVGWSEGGMLSQLYGISRHKTPSIHGLKVAATALYSAPSPFFWRYSPNQDYCSTDLDFTTQFPIQHISRSCDIPCNQEQQNFFGKDAIANHAMPISLWKNILINTLKNKNAEFSLIDDNGNPTNSCMPAGNGSNQCNQKRALLNHLNWPKKSETKMLNFLKKFQSLPGNPSVSVPQWVNANPGELNTQTCARVNLKPAQDVGYGICASGENTPTSGLNASSIIYPYGKWGTTTKGGTQIVPYSYTHTTTNRDGDRTTSSSSGIDCYANGAKQDHDKTDLAVAYLCVTK